MHLCACQNYSANFRTIASTDIIFFDSNRNTHFSFFIIYFLNLSNVSFEAIIDVNIFNNRDSFVFLFPGDLVIRSWDDSFLPQVEHFRSSLAADLLCSRNRSRRDVSFLHIFSIPAYRDIFLRKAAKSLLCWIRNWNERSKIGFCV